MGSALAYLLFMALFWGWLLPRLALRVRRCCVGAHVCGLGFGKLSVVVFTRTVCSLSSDSRLTDRRGGSGGCGRDTNGGGTELLLLVVAGV
jgi:hypothetical protein